MRSIHLFFKSLQTREQILLIAGLVAVCFYGIYMLVVQPWRHLHQELAQDILRLQQLKQDLATAYQPMQAFYQMQLQQYAHQEQHETFTRTSLLGLVDQNLVDTGLKPLLKNPIQTDDKTLTIQFDRAPFNTLMKCLSKLWYYHAIKPLSVNITRLDQPDQVEVSLTLSFAAKP